MSWRDYWNGDTPIYANERHKILHDAWVARDILRLIEGEDQTVLDFGCGEARSADELLPRCRKLWLCDGAPAIRARLSARFLGEPQIIICEPEEIEHRLEEASLDMIVLNSVMQYLDRPSFQALLAQFARKLKPGGTIILGDVISPDQNALNDVMALLRFAFQGGFFFAALKSLALMALSDYRRLRDDIGLTLYSEAEITALCAQAGLVCARKSRNIGHNQGRMTFIVKQIGL
jgi:SAM-dependent methyltransferase